ncbi:MAG: Sec-independent protein translocase protein TatB [Ilumatobacteraceae bacterium]|nr:Sec-independent protein translocase protein TatB [Ilumatobacteraceae bacterium]
MFNLQGGELIIIALLALVVLGPEKLPEAARWFGRMYAQIRRMGDGFTQEFQSVVKEPLDDLRTAVSEPIEEVKSSLDETIAASSPEGAVGGGSETVGSAPHESAGAEDMSSRSSTEGEEKPPS